MFLTRYLRAAVTVCAVLAFSGSASADIIVTFAETGSGVTITGSGSLATLDGLTFQTNTDLVAADQYFRNSSSAQIRSTVGTAELYFSDSGFSSFSSLGLTRALGGDPGVEFGIGNTSPNRVFLPEDYTASTLISFNVTNSGDTLADFGLTAGDSWGATWSTGNATTPTESILFQTQAVPEPNAGLLLVTVSMLFGVPRRRRRRPNTVRV